jgi:hypothetical protein
MLSHFACQPTHLFIWMRCRSGSAPDSALTFFASPKKVSKERRAQDRAAARFLALLGKRGVGLNSLRSNNARPDPLFPALLSPAFKGGGDKVKARKHQYKTPAHAPKAALGAAFGGSAVGISCPPRRYEEASSADGGGSGAQVFERSEFRSTPPPSSNAACPRSGPTNPARLFFAYFLLAKQKKVSALSGAQPDLQNASQSKPITHHPQQSKIFACP